MKSLEETLNSFILSVSGWRSIFSADQKENSQDKNIPASHAWLMIAIGYVLGVFFKNEYDRPVHIAIGRDSRPTGKRIEESLLRGILICHNISIEYLDVIAVTEIMNFTREETEIDGCIYISASHNPLGYNGLKISLSDGGVLNREKSEKLLSLLWEFVKSPNSEEILRKADTHSANSAKILETIEKQNSKELAFQSYLNFAKNLILGEDERFRQHLISQIQKKNIGIIGEMNGSARSTSIDSTFFTTIGVKAEWYNSEVGQFVHEIIPEGSSLDICSQILLEKNKNDPSFIFGYVPDCDGDRGNLVFYDEKIQKTRSLEAQEGFSLLVLSVISFHLYKKEYFPNSQKLPLAIIVNDATSLRIEEIVETFGGTVFRAEVGEANLLALADIKKKEGWDVILIGEGSNGGGIISPSRIRDPIFIVSSLIKLLSIDRVYQMWFSHRKIPLPTEKTISNILESVPYYRTTNVSEEKAFLKLPIKDQAKFKTKYLKNFRKEWESLKDLIPNLSSWEVLSFEGSQIIEGLPYQNPEASGGLKILLKDSKNGAIGSLWMRKSKTEPIFRLLVDLKEGKAQEEKLLLEWQRNLMITSFQ